MESANPSFESVGPAGPSQHVSAGRMNFCLRRVLIVSADEALAARLSEQIEGSEEFTALHAKSLTEAADRIKGGTPVDLALVDDDVPGKNELSPARHLRNRGFDKPIILLTQSELGPHQRVGDPGEADDVLPKTAKTAVLLMRLRVHDGAESRVNPHLQLGPYEFRPDRRELYAGGGRRVALTGKESALLLRLARARGRTVSKNLLLEQVWGYSANAATHTIETHVYRLRQKICAVIPICLVETSGGGYRLAI